MRGRPWRIQKVNRLLSERVFTVKAFCAALKERCNDTTSGLGKA